MFEGTHSALPTPFSGGAVDFDALVRVINHVLDNDVDGLVACATTGEAPTLTGSEWQAVVEATLASSRGKPVIVGTGTNSTASTIEKTRLAAKLGAAAALLVVPYYNKPTQAGLLNHFETVASSVDLPLILYNIPGRTGVNMDPSIVQYLSRLRNIVGIKEASGNLDQITDIISRVDPEEFVVLSGDDSLTLPMLSVGAKGVISTTASAAPAQMSGIWRNWAAGKPDEARELHHALAPLFKLLFVETNPGPLKAALSIMGLTTDEVRLPLCAMGPTHRKALEQTLAGLELV